MSRAFETENLIGQIQRTMILQVTIFLIPYTMFFVLWIGLDWDLWNSLTIPCITFAFATVGYVTFAEQVRREGLSVGGGPINMSIYWHESCVEDEPNVMLSWRSLEEKDINKIRDKMADAYMRPAGRVKSKNNPGAMSVLNREAYGRLEPTFTISPRTKSSEGFQISWSPIRAKPLSQQLPRSV